MKSKVIVKNENETLALAAKWLPLLEGKVIFLNGCLGAGKTTFVKYLAQTMGFPDDIYSPTFSIANNYSSPEGNIIHVDLYRLESEEELEMTGFYEMILKPGITVIIEWAEKFNIAPYIDKYITITINVLEDESREFILS